MSFDPYLSLYDEEVPEFLQEDLKDYGVHYDPDILGDYSFHRPIWRQFQTNHGKVELLNYLLHFNLFFSEEFLHCCRTSLGR